MSHRVNPLPGFSDIQKAVISRSDWGVKALKDLISIDSIAPGEQPCQEALAAILRSIGLQVELVPMDASKLRLVDGFIETGLTLENRPNLVCNFGRGDSKERSVIFNAHIDTVSWKEQLDKWVFHPLSGTIQEGKIYGRGAMDDKGGIMAAVTAVAALKDLGYTPAGKVIIESVVDEEPGGNGSLALCAQDYLADAVINLEPTDNQVAYGLRGVIGLNFRVSGEARHASVPGSHPNAIVEAGQIAGVLEHALEGWQHPSDGVYGPPTVNVGRIEGGNDIFTTPLNCTIEYGIRYAPGTYEAILAHITGHIKELAPKVMQTFDRVSIETFAHFDAAETSIDDPLVQTLLKCVQLVEPDRGLVAFPGGSDARHFINRYHIPTVVYGPSPVYLAHAENEYLDLDQWLRSTQVLALFITNWCK